MPCCRFWPVIFNSLWQGNDKFKLLTSSFLFQRVGYDAKSLHNDIIRLKKRGNDGRTDKKHFKSS